MCRNMFGIPVCLRTCHVLQTRVVEVRKRLRLKAGCKEAMNSRKEWCTSMPKAPQRALGPGGHQDRRIQGRVCRGVRPHELFHMAQEWWEGKRVELQH
jgi:hypothetical protein